MNKPRLLWRPALHWSLGLLVIGVTLDIGFLLMAAVPVCCCWLLLVVLLVLRRQPLLLLHFDSGAAVAVSRPEQRNK